MFAAYAAKSSSVTKDGDEEEGEIKDESEKLAREQAEREKHEEKARRMRERDLKRKREEQAKEAMFHNSVTGGYYEDDDDYGGSLGMELPSIFHVDVEEIKNLNVMKRKAPAKPDFNSFPTQQQPATINVREPKKDIDNDNDDERRRRKRKKEKKKKSKNRKHSKYSDEDDDYRSSKRKRHRSHRRRNRSSSSSRSPSRSPSPSSSRRSNYPISVKAGNPGATVNEKWSIITKDDVAYVDTRDMTNLFVWSRKLDTFMSLLDKVDKRETVRCFVRSNGVDGADEKFLNIMYPEKIGRKEKKSCERDFLKKQKDHVASEREFRPRVLPTNSTTGFFAVSMDPFTHTNFEDIVKREDTVFHEGLSRNVTLSSLDLREITNLQTRRQTMNARLAANPKDVDLWLEFLKNEDEIFAMDRANGLQDGDKRAYRDRKRAILQTAIRNNRKVALFKTLEIDLSIEDGVEPKYVIDLLEDLVHIFPHECHAWKKYLDYVQYTAYNKKKLEDTFQKFFTKMRGFFEGTFLSHISLVRDMNELREFSLDVYIRYLRWLTDSGQANVAIANIQATFEMNFGLGADRQNEPFDQREMSLKLFWELRLPRIGDPNARGAKTEIDEWLKKSKDEKLRSREQEALQKERVESEKQLYTLLKAFMKLKNGCSISKSFVDFERDAEEADARVKRNPLQLGCGFEHLEATKISSSVEWDQVTPFAAYDKVQIDFVQPLLEFLGAEILYKERQYQSTHDFIREYRNVANMDVFSPLPASKPLVTFVEVAANILRYLRLHFFKFNPDGTLTQSSLESLFLEACTRMKAESASLGSDVERVQEILKKVKQKAWLTSEYGNEAQEDHRANLALLLAIKIMIEKWLTDAKGQLSQIKNYTDYEEADLKIKKVQQRVLQRMDRIIPALNSGAQSYFEEKGWFAETRLALFQYQFYIALIRIQLTEGDSPSDSNRLKLMYLRNLLLRKKDAEWSNEVTNQELNEMRAALNCIDNILKEIRRREHDSPQLNQTAFPFMPSASALFKSIGVYFLFLKMKPENAQRDAEMAVKAVLSAEEEERRIFEHDVSSRFMLLHTVNAFDIVNNSLKGVLRGLLVNVLERGTRYFSLEPKFWIKLLDIRTAGYRRLIGAVEVKNRKADLVERSGRKPGAFDAAYQVRDSLNLIYVANKRLEMISEDDQEDQLTAGRVLFDTIQHVASADRDPVLWRMAIRAARKINHVKETHVRATGQCVWARDLHLDLLEAEPGENNLYEVMQLMHEYDLKMFIDDIDVLKTMKMGSSQSGEPDDIQMSDE